MTSPSALNIFSSLTRCEQVCDALIACDADGHSVRLATVIGRGERRTPCVSLYQSESARSLGRTDT